MRRLVRTAAIAVVILVCVLALVRHLLARAYDHTIVLHNARGQDIRDVVVKYYVGQLDAQDPGVLAWSADQMAPWQSVDLRVPAGVGGLTIGYHAEGQACELRLGMELGPYDSYRISLLSGCQSETSYIQKEWR